MVANCNQTARDSDCNGKDKVFLVGGETKPLENAGRVKLDILPLPYVLWSFHLRLNGPSRTGELPCPEVRKRDDTSTD
jgi:hypothetical protein